MKEYVIQNFVGMWPIIVSPTSGPCGPLVSVKQFAGANHFQHSMTTEQALQMADALLDAVAELTAQKEVAHAE